MNLKQTQQGACPSINIAGTEYSPDDGGAVTINDPAHIEIAQREGFADVAAPAPATISKEK